MFNMNDDLCDMMNSKEQRKNDKANANPMKRGYVQNTQEQRMGNAIDAYNQQAYTNWNDNILEPCPNCGRTFLPEKIPMHMKGCKKGKPLKQPLQKGVDIEEKLAEQRANNHNLGAAAR